MRKIINSIIIATKDRPFVFNKCFTAVLKQINDHTEIIVVNDGSNKENNVSYKRIIEKHKNNLYVAYIENEKNIGRSAIRNKGIKIARANIIVFIDDDAIPKSNWLREITYPFHESRMIGGVSGKINPFKDQEYFYIPKTYNEGNKIKEIKYVIQEGNCAFKKDIIIEAGLLDPNIKLAHEGMDVSIRIKKLGYKFIYNPNAIIYHAPPNPMKVYQYCMREYSFGERLAYINRKYNFGIWELFFGNKVEKALFTIYYLIFLLNIIAIIYSIFTLNILMNIFLIVFLLISTMILSIFFKWALNAKNLIVGLILFLSRLFHKTGIIVGYIKFLIIKP